jgi:hypothetical protein
MSVLVFCAHMFQHHISGPCTIFLPRIRLDELADIQDILLLPTFNQEYFVSLIELFCAQDSVSCAGHFLNLMILYQ